MALNIDHSKPLTSHDDQLRLIQAVLAAGHDDESDWIEWKSTLDLKTAKDQVALARTILGMANRDPATTSGRGYGYILVGVSPQGVTGIDPIDPADLSTHLHNCMGTDNGPRWQSEIHKVENRHVLVVTVDPPKPGDDIYPLRRALDPPPKGQIFVRVQGKTQVADDKQIDALVRRVRARTKIPPVLTVELMVGEPLHWLDIAAIEDELHRYIESTAQQLRRQASSSALGSAAVLEGNSLASRVAHEHAARLLRPPQEDARSRLLGATEESAEAFSSRIDKWASDARGQVREVAYGCFATHCDNPVQLVVTNPSNHNFVAVELRLQLSANECATAICEDLPASQAFDDPPTRLRSAGPIPASLLAASKSNFNDSIAIPRYPAFKRTSNIYIDTDSQELIFEVGDLRPGRDNRSDEFYLLPARPESDQLAVQWDLTAGQLDGMLQGKQTVRIERLDLTLDQVLDQSPPE